MKLSIKKTVAMATLCGILLNSVQINTLAETNTTPR